MTQTTYGLPTNIGDNKSAQAWATATPIIATHVAIGDGTRIPTGGESSLESEVFRRPISGQGVADGNPNVAYFEITITHEDGPAEIREAGVYDQDGDMIGIAKYDPVINIPAPEAGQPWSLVLRTHVLFSKLQNVNLAFEFTTGYASADREINTGEGIKGGGPLDIDRTHSLDISSLATLGGANVADDDCFLVWDDDAGEHKIITRPELLFALLGDISLFSTDAELVAAITEFVTAAAIAVRPFEHADNTDAPTNGEWPNPTNGAKAIVSNAATDKFKIYQYRVDTWVGLAYDTENAGEMPGWTALEPDTLFTFDATKSWEFIFLDDDPDIGGTSNDFVLINSQSMTGVYGGGNWRGFVLRKSSAGIVSAGITAMLIGQLIVAQPWASSVNNSTHTYSFAPSGNDDWPLWLDAPMSGWYREIIHYA